MKKGAKKSAKEVNIGYGAIELLIFSDLWSSILKKKKRERRSGAEKRSNQNERY